MATLVFGKAPTGDFSQVVLGEKNALKEQKNGFLANTLAQQANSSAFDPFFAESGPEEIIVWHKAEQCSVLASISDKRCRTNAIIRADLIHETALKHIPYHTQVHVVVVVENKAQVFAAGCAVARAFPLYTKKTDKKPIHQTAYIEVVSNDGATANYTEMEHTAHSIRLAARFTEMPTNELNTDTYQAEVATIMKELSGVKVTTIAGEELRNKGIGGIWGVGKAAEHLPALVILEYRPAGASKTLALVGKGIMFDTGGLSLKGKDFICGMKEDMGGSAAVVGAFRTLVKNNFKQNLYGLLCLAENSVDKASTRPDDVLTMYSGKTVEINNTDAEGRLVLGDGVSYASKHLNPDIIIDIATLTGAQGIATGKKHAAIVSNDEELETKTVQVGKQCGDLVYPVLYCPEFLMPEFKSLIADMKNSVKNRANAQTSCAAHFIEAHLNSDYKGKWLHVDMAAQSNKDGRSYGYGVALLSQLAQTLF